MMECGELCAKLDACLCLTYDLTVMWVWASQDECVDCRSIASFYFLCIPVFTSGCCSSENMQHRWHTQAQISDGAEFHAAEDRKYFGRNGVILEIIIFSAKISQTLKVHSEGHLTVIPSSNTGSCCVKMLLSTPNYKFSFACDHFQEDSCMETGLLSCCWFVWICVLWPLELLKWCSGFLPQSKDRN